MGKHTGRLSAWSMSVQGTAYKCVYDLTKSKRGILSPVGKLQKKFDGLIAEAVSTLSQGYMPLGTLFDVLAVLTLNRGLWVAGVAGDSDFLSAQFLQCFTAWFRESEFGEDDTKNGNPRRE